MNKENSIEMSAVDNIIPRYYKGFDMDIIMKKVLENKLITEEEKNALGEAQNIYRKEHFDKIAKQVEKLKADNKGNYRRSITHYMKQ